MDAVIKNITDPNWLFTGIIVGVFVNFLSDWIGRLFGLISESYRRIRKTALEIRLKKIEALAENPIYLSFELHRATVLIIFWVASILMFYYSKIMSYVDSASMWPDQYALIPLIGFVNGILGYYNADKLSILSHAISQYRKKHGLPKL